MIFCSCAVIRQKKLRDAIRKLYKSNPGRTEWRVPHPGQDPPHGVRAAPDSANPCQRAGGHRRRGSPARRRASQEDQIKGAARVIELLNDALRHELTATSQFWLHYRLLENWGFGEMARKWRGESIEEMELAAALIALDAVLEHLDRHEPPSPEGEDARGGPDRTTGGGPGASVRA